MSYSKLLIFLESFDGEEDEQVSTSTIFGAVTPPPIDSVKIEMQNVFAIEKLREAITFSISGQGTNITIRTWKRIARFLQQGDEYWISRQNQIKVEIFLVVSKLNHKEYYERMLELDPSIKKSLNECVSNLICDMVQTLMAESLYFCKVDSTELASIRIKQFLQKPIILQAFKNVLSKIFLPQRLTTECIKESISSMNIYTTMALHPLCGSTVSDGIVIILQRNMLFLAEWPKYVQAAVFTLAAHETAHYMARRLANNFNFSSPYSLRESNPIREDPIISAKPLELGRALELEVFNCQPFWQWPQNEMGEDAQIAEAAAKEFFSRLEGTHNLPLFTTDDIDKFNIKKREIPSLSLGAEFLYSVTSCIMLD